MSTSICDMIRGTIAQKMYAAGMFVPDENFKGNSWDSPIYKRSERLLHEVLEGTEEGDYEDGRMEDIMQQIEFFAQDVFQSIEHKLTEAPLNEFDPQI